MLRVGLTGGTGSGKTTVAGQLAELGAVVIDADVLARQVVAPGSAGLAQIVDEFGSAMLTSDGALDRAAMADCVFADPVRRGALEAITHPLIEARTRELIAAAPADAVLVHDMPLIVEKGAAADYHLVVVVDAPVELRVERLTGRGMAAADARARIAAQAGHDQRVAAADVWVDNSGTPDQLRPVLEELWQRLVVFESNVRHRQVAARPSTLVLSEPDPSWAAQAERLLARVRRVAGSRVISAEHIGSTSVPGLPAKNIIDLQLVVADLGRATTLGDDLAASGFVPHPGRWWDELLGGGELLKMMCGAADPGRPVNLHVRDRANPFVHDTLALRDHLRAHPEVAADYARIKREIIAGRPGDVDAYSRAKTPFIAATLRAARGN